MPMTGHLKDYHFQGLGEHVHISLI